MSLTIVAAGEGMYHIDTPSLPVNVAAPVSWLYWFDMTSCEYVANNLYL